MDSHSNGDLLSPVAVKFPLPKVPKARHSMKTIYIGLTFCAVLCAFVGLGFLLFDPLVKHIILQRLVLRNNSEIADIWENPPIVPHLKIYFFNLTNAEDFFAGKSKPILQEVGPYTFHQKWIKENVTWHGNGTMSYQTRKEFTFRPELSVGDQYTDVIITANVPALSAFYQMRKSAWFTKYLLDMTISSLEYKGWTIKSPAQLIWGYDEPLFELASLTSSNAPALEKFGFFSKKNATTNIPTYTMYTGESNPYNLSKISMVDGRDSLNKWSEDQCNIVQGSDGATFNPYIQKTDTLWFFNEELCRSLPMVFDRDVTHAGSLPGLRFSPRQDVFMTPRSFPENTCYCDGAEKELCDRIGDGMFAVSSCQFDAPIILSWPHFLHANRSYQESVVGLTPVPEKHSFYFEVQPITGTTLAAKARIQINMAITNDPTFTAVKEVENTILPLVWFEEGLDELGPDLIEVIGQAVLAPPVYKNYLLCVLMGLGAATTIIGFVAIVQRCLNRHRHCASRRHQQLLNEQLAATLDKKDDMFQIVGDSRLAQMRNILQQTCAANAARLPFIRVQCGCILATAASEASFCSVHQPMLYSQATSTESSRMTSASHSRNSSTGSTPPFVNPDDVDVESSRKSFLSAGISSALVNSRRDDNDDDVEENRKSLLENAD